jgi:ElaB/YqjD/DUF883 family membrane-anchored ribosome-binding protein
MTDDTSEESAAIAEELRNVVNQAEELLGALGGGDATLESLRERVYASIDTARERLAEIEDQANRAGSRLAAAAEVWVQENPWTALALGAGIGFAIGMLLTRGRRRRRPAASSANAEAQ